MKIGSLCSAVFAVAVAGLTTAEGYIGNTEEELSKRYGESAAPTELYPTEKATTRLYHFNQLDILVNIVDGHSWSEFYRKRDRSELTANEIKQIVFANTGREPPVFRPGDGIITATIGDVSVTYDPLHQALYIASRDHPTDAEMSVLASNERRAIESESERGILKFARSTKSVVS